MWVFQRLTWFSRSNLLAEWVVRSVYSLNIPGQELDSLGSMIETLWAAVGSWKII